MLSILSSDIIECICLNLDTISILNFIKTAKNNCLSDSFFKMYCYKLYGPKFWENAWKRSHKYHSQSWKQELYRIEKFQKMIVEIEGKRWKDHDFYKLWRNQDP